MPAVGTARAELFSDGREEFIELSYELICVCSVNLAGICDGFASGAGAAEAMHADGEEQGCDLRCKVKNLPLNCEKIVVKVV